MSSNYSINNPFWYSSHYIRDYTNLSNRSYFSIQNLFIIILIVSFTIFII